MKINKKISILILLLISLVILCSIPATFAAANNSASNGFFNDKNENYAGISVNKNIFTIEKTKIPVKYNAYKNKTFQISKRGTINYKAIVNPKGNLIYNLAGIKVKKAYIDFGDGTKKKSTGWIAHTYKKTGWYIIKVTISDATFNSSENYIITGVKSNGTVTNVTKEYLVYVSNKAQLSTTGITRYSNSVKELKKGNINFLVIKVTNIGAKSSKATKLKIWYEKKNSVGKIDPNLKKFTKTALIKALKPGKSTSVRVYFSIPKKYAKIVKNIKLDYLNKVNQINKADNLYRFL
ncbi:MAG: CARDB domain-containing protein [Methanobacteriaceae archaeon]